jgi:hypothetical protein
MAKKSRIKKEKIKKDIKEHLAKYVGAGLGLVASLAWSDAIRSFIESYFSFGNDTVLAKFIYAIIMTLFVVLATVYLLHILKIEKKS